MRTGIDFHHQKSIQMPQMIGQNFSIWMNEWIVNSGIFLLFVLFFFLFLDSQVVTRATWPSKHFVNFERLQNPVLKHFLLSFFFSAFHLANHMPSALGHCFYFFFFLPFFLLFLLSNISHWTTWLSILLWTNMLHLTCCVISL